jgi:hypothetical protein
LRKEGVRVVINDIKSPIEALSCEIDYQPLDVGDKNSIAMFFDNVEKVYGGLIVNIGSFEGIANNPEHAPCAASKGGVQGLTRASPLTWDGMEFVAMRFALGGP